MYSLPNISFLFILYLLLLFFWCGDVIWNQFLLISLLEAVLQKIYYNEVHSMWALASGNKKNKNILDLKCLFHGCAYEKSYNSSRNSKPKLWVGIRAISTSSYKRGPEGQSPQQHFKQWKQRRWVWDSLSKLERKLKRFKISHFLGRT